MRIRHSFTSHRPRPETGLSLPACGLADTGRSVLVPDAVNEETGRELAILPICFEKLCFKSLNFLFKCLHFLFGRQILRLFSIRKSRFLTKVQPLAAYIREKLKNFGQVFPQSPLAFGLEPLIEVLRTFSNMRRYFGKRNLFYSGQIADSFKEFHLSAQNSQYIY